MQGTPGWDFVKRAFGTRGYPFQEGTLIPARIEYVQGTTGRDAVRQVAPVSDSVPLSREGTRIKRVPLSRGYSYQEGTRIKARIEYVQGTPGQDAVRQAAPVSGSVSLSQEGTRIKARIEAVLQKWRLEWKEKQFPRLMRSSFRCAPSQCLVV